MTPEARDFIIANGWRARADHLARVLDALEPDVTRLRGRGVCRSLPKPLNFGELFAKRHGRPPSDDEWPAPRKRGAGGYEWLAPEQQLLARLVGTVGRPEICRILTERLQQLTGDRSARRDGNAVNMGCQRIGLEMKDVVGGLTVQQAAREIGTRSIIDHEIRHGRLKTFRVGRYVVVPYDEWERWKSTRVQPPEGFIRLHEVQKKLGIRSDKLSEWARQGYVPTAVRCSAYGTSQRSTRWGTWYIDPKAARKLIADRRAGRPMPWHGKPEPWNLRTTWTLWRKRQHPERCETCRGIWGPGGAPQTFEEYSHRYPPLAHGAKRHLTRPYSDGLTVEQLARDAGVAQATVQRAIEVGVLRARKVGRAYCITRTDATRWKARKCATGENPKSWVALKTARKLYAFSLEELQGHIDGGRLKTRTGVAGAAAGVTYVLKQQVRELRDELGYREAEAARRAGVSIARLRVLLRGVNWRQSPRIPADTVLAVIKRKNSGHGVALSEAAKILRKPVSWVRNEINAGMIHPLRTKWQTRLYITFPMFKRLCDVALEPPDRHRLTAEWLWLSEAAHLAGVSIQTVQKWALEQSSVKSRETATGRRYHRRSLMARARRYWASEVRFKRAQPPAWLRAEAA